VRADSYFITTLYGTETTENKRERKKDKKEIKKDKIINY